MKLARIAARGSVFAALAFAASLTSVHFSRPALGEEAPRVMPAPQTVSVATTAKSQTAVLAGGCFWGLEGVFEHVRGVTRVRSGYSGGGANNANYSAVSSGITGHAEAVEIVFDPKIISYGEILRIYFSVATDPTQLNRQGPDEGTQYRSNIFFSNASQENVARAYVAQLQASKAFSRPIVTRIDPLKKFYPAENYHQNYLSLHPTQGYIVANDLPKIINLKRLFPDLYVAKRTA